MTAPSTSAALILASRSRARIALMANAGLTFDAVPAGVSEDALKAERLAQNARPATIASDLADAKALDVSKARPAALVIGADQTLDLDGRLFDKPADLHEARAQLLALRGRPHRLHSALALAHDGAIVWRTVETATLYMRAFSEAFLAHYLTAEAEHVVHCVGAYRLEGLGVQLFERIDGDYFTILGLPLQSLLEILRFRGQIPS